MFEKIMIVVCLVFVFMFPLYVGLAIVSSYLVKSKQRLKVFSEKLDLVLDVLDIKYSNEENIKTVKAKANAIARIIIDSFFILAPLPVIHCQVSGCRTCRSGNLYNKRATLIPYQEVFL